MTVTLTTQKVYNHLHGEYKVKVYNDDADNSETQVVALSPSVGIPPVSPQTATQTLNSSITTTSSTVLSSNSSRKGGYLVCPATNTDTVYVSLNDPATTDDIPLAARQVFNLSLHFGGPAITNAVYARSASGTQKLIVVEA